MSRWTAGLSAVVVLAIAGCGGGGDAPSTPSPTQAPAGVSAKEAQAAAADYRTRLRAFADELGQAGDNDRRLARVAAAPPQLEPLDSDDPAYVKAKATADAVKTASAELAIVAREPSKRAARLYNDQYMIGSDHWSQAFKLDTKRYDELSSFLYADDGSFADTGHRDDLRVQRIWRSSGLKEIAYFERAAKRMKGLKTHNAIERSTVEYALDEYDRSIALWREFRKQMQEPTQDDQIGWYTSVVTSQDGYHTAGAAITRKRDGLERGFVRTIRRLAAGQKAAPGDAYRTAILSGFISPLKKDKLRDSKVTDRGWMLFRIKQMEDTPDQAYEEARGTLQLENIDDARNAYSDLLQIYELHDLATDPKGNRLPRMAAYRDWAHEKLSRTFPPLLQPMAQRMDTLIAQYPDRTNWDKVIKTSDDIERALRKGAKAADDPKQLKAALKDALEATRTQDGAATSEAAPEA